MLASSLADTTTVALNISSDDAMAGVNHRHLQISYDISLLDAYDWITGGVDSFQMCPDGQAVKGLCSSGKNRDCTLGSSSYTSTGCGNFLGDVRTEAAGEWQCVDPGVWKACPSDMIMMGVCGSGQAADCRQHCDQDSHAAIRCAPLAEHMKVYPGEWSDPIDHGRYRIVSEEDVGSVFCGACQSGGNADCDGGYFRYKLCRVEYTDEAYGVVGRWSSQYEVVGEITAALRHGSSRTTEISKTNEWADKVTVSVETGLEVEGFGVKSTLTVESSQSFSKTYREEWNSFEESEFSIKLGQDHQGLLLWQWVFEIMGPRGDLVTAKSRSYALTEGADQPPRCQPNYSVGTTTDYQQCTSPDRLLPGFSSVSEVTPTVSPVTLPDVAPDASPAPLPIAPDASFAVLASLAGSTGAVIWLAWY